MREMNGRVQEVLASLEKLSSKATRDGMARYGIFTDKAMGVPVGKMQGLAKQIGKDHELAGALWETGWYEARMVAAFIDDPSMVTAAQMERWCKDFDNWGICDTVCFHLFDRTPHAFGKIVQWSKRKNEFEKRAAFALLACVALHNKKAGDAEFLKCLPLVEKAAEDERNFVKKGVSWALRLMGRRNAALNEAAVEVSRRLAVSEVAAARWVGKGALKELTSAGVVKRLKGK